MATATRLVLQAGAAAFRATAGGWPWRRTTSATGRRCRPADCEGYVGHYIYAGRALPRQDSLVVVDEAIAYAEGLELGGGGREVWVFDIDETSLSNLPYYAKHGFGYVRSSFTFVFGSRANGARLVSQSQVQHIQRAAVWFTDSFSLAA